MIEARELGTSQRGLCNPSSSLHPHLLWDYHVIPDCRQPGRVKRSLYYNSAFTLIMSQSSWINVGWLDWEIGRRKSRNHRPVTTGIDKLPHVPASAFDYSNRKYLTVTLSHLKANADNKTSPSGLSTRNTQKNIKPWVVFVVATVAAALCCEQGSRFWFQVLGSWSESRVPVVFGVCIWRHCVYASRGPESQTFSTRFGPE